VSLPLKNLIALTTIPRRLKTSLNDVFSCLTRQDLKCDVVISIPRSYQKWGALEEKEFSNIPSWVNIHRPTEDFGPATKLLGALEFAAEKNYDNIITIDDDVTFSASDYLTYLAGFAQMKSGIAWTIGGIQLSCWPYSNRFGLRYNSEYCYVNAVCGVSGTVYPVRELMASNLPFTLREVVPPGAFHDDDAYFGAVLHSMKIPLIAAPSHPKNLIVNVASAGESAVAEKQTRHRRANESEFFRDSVRKNRIGHSLFKKRPPAELIVEMQKHVQRFT
jgi:hypothetical protein